MSRKPTGKYAPGKTFGYLTIVRILPRQRYESGLIKNMSECTCVCGKTVITRTHGLGRTKKSCGCKTSDLIISSQTRHGHTRRGWCSPTWRSWHAAKQRCFNHKHSHFQYYGAKGIVMCDRWRDSFEAFLEDMGAAPSEKHSIDRYPNQTGNYEPGNCRWATWAEQCENRRPSRIVEVEGVSRCLAAHARRYGLTKTTVYGRLKRGYSIEQALGLMPH